MFGLRVLIHQTIMLSLVCLLWPIGAMGMHVIGNIIMDMEFIDLMVLNDHSRYIGIGIRTVL